jgi:hypothetical protein
MNLKRDQRGFAIFSIFLLLILLASLGAATLLFTSMDLRSTSHYATGRQAFFAAEAGILHALGTINGRGVQNFQTDIVPSADWTRLYGSSVKALPSDGSSGYTVAISANATDPVNRGRITAIGTGPLLARRVLAVELRKSIPGSQGALYMANDNVTPEFGARDQFLIDGNDHNTDGSLNPSGPVRPGIATRNDDVTQLAKDTLSDPQKMRVQGDGFSLDPLDPSIKTTGGPDVTDLERIVQNILNLPGVVEENRQTITSGNYGSLAAPQITHMTSSRTKIEGSFSGVGILISDGDFEIQGDANFLGWMIVRGATVLASDPNSESYMAGNSMILGSLWTGDLVVQVGGSAIIDYCEACMELVDSLAPGLIVPRVMAVSSWQEVL